MNGDLIRSIGVACVTALPLAACQAQPPSGPVSFDPNVPAMQGTQWFWTSSTIAGADVIPDPKKYNITFASDGTFSATVDCNQVSCQFTITPTEIAANRLVLTSPNGAMTFAPTPTAS
jgi:heat shock protein HslJ